MVSFSDSFARTDQDLHANNGWQVATDPGGGASDSIELFSSYATNSSTLGAGTAFQQDTVPTQVDQSVAAWVTALAEDAASIIKIGVGGKYDATYASRTERIWLQIEWLAAGERVVRLKWNEGASTKTLASLTMVADGSDVQTGYAGKMLDDGALGTLQHVRLIVTAVDAGLLVRGYVNQPDDQSPTIQGVIRSDWIDLTPDSDVGVYGAWWFAVAQHGTARSLLITDFEAQDYTVTERQSTVQRSDAPTRAEIERRVRQLIEGSLRTSLDEQVLHDLVNDAIAEVDTALGEMAYYARRTAVLTLTPDSEGLVTLPAYIRSLIYLERSADLGEALWEEFGQDTDGSLILRMPRNHGGGSGSYRAKYWVRGLRLEKDDDQTAIPREHVELIVLGVARRIAERDREPFLHQVWTQRYGERLLGLRQDMARRANAEKHRIKPRQTSWRRRYPRYTV